MLIKSKYINAENTSTITYQPSTSQPIVTSSLLNELNFTTSNIGNDVMKSNFDSLDVTPTTTPLLATTTNKTDDSIVDKALIMMEGAGDSLNKLDSFLESIGIGDSTVKTQEQVNQDLDNRTKDFVDSFLDSSTWSKIKNSMLNEYKPFLIVGGLFIAGVAITLLARKLR
jgi:hypothetical protein